MTPVLKRLKELAVCLVFLGTASPGLSAQTPVPRDTLLAAAREIMEAARYCGLVTVDSSGCPRPPSLTSTRICVQRSDCGASRVIEPLGWPSSITSVRIVSTGSNWPRELPPRNRTTSSRRDSEGPGGAMAIVTRTGW